MNTKGCKSNIEQVESHLLFIHETVPESPSTMDNRPNWKDNPGRVLNTTLTEDDEFGCMRAFERGICITLFALLHQCVKNCWSAR
jgi:hypothetical protein